ncbi:MAG: OmpP1/FadL family transporter [Weeksellaceae bacterium]
MKKNLIGLLLLITIPSLTYAGGYRVSLQGVRQAALGAQGAVLSHDASVAFFNPAALAFVDSKFSVAIGGFGIKLNSTYQNPNTFENAETNNPVGTPLYAAASYKPTDKLALGVSLTTPFGSTIDWGNEWGGRYVIDRIELKSYFIQPTVSYRFNDWFGVGVGYIMASGEVNIQKQVSVGDTDGSSEISTDDASGNGFNVGVYIKPHDKVTLGVAYRSIVRMKVDNGDVSFNNIPSLALANPNLPFNSTKFDAELPLPYEAIFGISYQATPKLLLLGEVGSVGWEEYSSLDIILKDYTNPEVKTTDVFSEQDYSHTYNYSFGAEYAATDNIALRLGYKYDKSPSPDAHFNPQTPTVNYHAFTAGIGAAYRNFNIDLMGEYIHGEERSFNNVDTGLAGDIYSKGYIFGLGLSYNIK